MIEIELTDDLKRQAASIWMHRAKTAEARNARLVTVCKDAAHWIIDPDWAPTREEILDRLHADGE